MFSQLLSAIKLRQELPDAFGYFISEHFRMPSLPSDITTELLPDIKDKIINLSTSYLYIENYSNHTKKNVRVFYSGCFLFTPNVELKRRKAVNFTGIDFLEQEIYIKEIPPNESVIIQLFDISDDFSIDQVVVDERSVTPMMQKLAEMKRHPELTKMNFHSSVINIIMCIIVLCTFVFTAYTAWDANKKNTVLEKVTDRFYSCHPEIFNNSIEKEKELERRFLQLGQWRSFTLSMNNTPDFESLKLKDTVILCVPNISD